MWVHCFLQFFMISSEWHDGWTNVHWLAIQIFFIFSLVIIFIYARSYLSCPNLNWTKLGSISLVCNLILYCLSLALILRFSNWTSILHHILNQELLPPSWTQIIHVNGSSKILNNFPWIGPFIYVTWVISFFLIF